MKITLVHGETQIQISGKQSLKKMKNAVKDIFDSLPVPESEREDPPNPIGFSVGATVERAETIEYIWDDEDEE